MDKDIAGKIETFFLQYPLKRFKKGEIIIYGGEEPSGIFHLLSGKVRQYDIAQSGDEIVVNVFKPPAFFPMSWAINRRKNFYFFETVTPVEIRQAPPGDVIRFLHDNPEVMYNLLSRLYSGADGLERRMAHLMGGSARSRILFELTIECKRFGERLEGDKYRLSVTESELGQRAGLSRETTNRELSRLKSQGLIQYVGGLIVNDARKIEDELGEGL